MRLPLLLLLLTVSVVSSDEMNDIAVHLMKRQILGLAYAVKRNNYEEINKYFYIPEVFPRLDDIYEDVIRKFSNGNFVPTGGEFIQKHILNGTLIKTKDNGAQEPYSIVMERNAGSPTDWKIYKLNKLTD